MSVNEKREIGRTEDSKSMTTPSPKEIALRFNRDGWGTNPNWQTVWDEIVSPNVIHHFNDEPEPIVGLENNKAFNASLFDGFPDIVCTLEEIIAEGDNVVYKTTLKGTHQGTLVGIPPTGKVIQVTDFTLIKVRDKKIVEWWYTCNFLAVMEQLGVMSR